MSLLNCTVVGGTGVDACVPGPIAFAADRLQLVSASFHGTRFAEEDFCTMALLLLFTMYHSDVRRPC